jgi:hypothetical protein
MFGGSATVARSRRICWWLQYFLHSRAPAIASFSLKTCVRKCLISDTRLHNSYNIFVAVCENNSPYPTARRKLYYLGFLQIHLHYVLISVEM